MKKVWEWLKTNWKAVISVLGTIIGYILLKDKLQGGLKAKLKNANAEGKNAVLEERKSNTEKDRLDEEYKQKALREQLGKNSNNSDSDIVDFWKKKK